MTENAIWQRTIAGMQIKVWTALILQYTVFAIVLFGAAGTVSWAAGWAFIVLFAFSVTLMSIRLAKLDPALLEERMKIIPQQDQPLWDRIIMGVLYMLFLTSLIVPGLDAVRFGWSEMPFWFQVTGGIAMVASLWAAHFVMRQNSYLAPTVRIQHERGHKVISTGAYGVVRHPFYAVLIPFFPAAALLLGSWWSALMSGLIALLLAYRSVREEHYLRQELEGYADYMDKVRYRLIPYVW